MKYLKDNKLLYEYQSGFRQSYSTDTCLINLITDLGFPSVVAARVSIKINGVGAAAGHN